MYCSITGYGQEGPYRNLVGHDVNYLGIAGALELMGTKDGAPVIPGLSIADIGGGAPMAAIGILSALLARQHTGKGQFVDVAMTDGIVAWLSIHAGAYFANRVVPRRGEMPLAGAFPCYQVYETRDGKYLTIGCVEDHFWRNLCAALGIEEFIEHQWSLEKRDEIFERFRSVFRTRTRDDWFAFFRDRDVCAGPSYTLAEAFDDAHLAHRQMVVETEHPIEGRIEELGCPIKMSGTPAEIRMPSPQLGEHTQEILESIGFSKTEISTMAEAGIV